MKEKGKKEKKQFDRIVSGAMLRQTEPYSVPEMRNPREDDILLGELTIPMRHLLNFVCELEEAGDSENAESSEPARQLFEVLVLRAIMKIDKLSSRKYCGAKIRTDWKIVVVKKGTPCAECDNEANCRSPTKKVVLH